MKTTSSPGPLTARSALAMAPKPPLVTQMSSGAKETPSRGPIDSAMTRRDGSSFIL